MNCFNYFLSQTFGTNISLSVWMEITLSWTETQRKGITAPQVGMCIGHAAACVWQVAIIKCNH